MVELDTTPTALDGLLAAADADPDQLPAFLDALRGADVHVLGDQTPDGAVSLTSWSDAQGVLLPFFTSGAMLARTVRAVPEASGSFLVMPAQTFWTMTRGQRLVLNPHGGAARAWSPAQVASTLLQE